MTNTQLLLLYLLINTVTSFTSVPLAPSSIISIRQLPSRLYLIYGMAYDGYEGGEKFIREERETLITPRAFTEELTDDEEATTGAFRLMMARKAVQVFATLVETESPEKSCPKPGQGGFVKMFDDTTQTETARLVTCKHLWSAPGFILSFCNILSYQTMNYNLFTGPQFDLCKSDRLLPVNLRDDIKWKDGFGVAIAKSKILTAENVPAEASTFEFVGPDFEYEVGQKIGMAVGTTSLQLSDLASRIQGQTSKSLQSVYGQMDGSVHIHTGEITRVENQHIEHDINTIPGFSGAMIFLLDQKQPLSVAKQDYGKVIAVHVGAPKKLLGTANIGFRCCVDGKTCIP